MSFVTFILKYYPSGRGLTRDLKDTSRIKRIGNDIFGCFDKVYKNPFAGNKQSGSNRINTLRLGERYIIVMR
jgi:hypothetical protein